MCWDANITLENKGNVTWTEIIVFVTFHSPRSEFPQVDEWYDGISGEASPVHGNPSRKWLVKFRVRVPPGESVHVGWDFEESIGFDPPEGGLPSYGSLVPRLEQEGTAYAVVAGTPDGEPVAIVERVAFAASPERLPLEVLIEDSKPLAALDWHRPDIQLPAKTAPGEDLFRHEISLERLRGAKSFVWVAKLAGPDGGSGYTIFGQGPLRPFKAAGA